MVVGTTTQGLANALMQVLDEIEPMTYNTTIANAEAKLLPWLTIADAIPETVRPKVFGGVEVSAGVGSGVSYADTAGKNSKTGVLSDITTIEADFYGHPSFSGFFIETESAWVALP